MSLKQKLETLEQILGIKRPQLLGLLNEGLNESAIKDKIENLGFETSEDLLNLYQWKNGFNYPLTHNDELFIDGYFMDLDWAIEEFKIENVSEPEWKSLFFPLFSGQGVLILIGIDKTHDSYNKIYIHDRSTSGYMVYGKAIVLYTESLENLILSAIECYEKEAYTFDFESGELQIDWELSLSIYRRINASCEYWQK
jgi:hypothetical protein